MSLFPHDVAGLHQSLAVQCAFVRAAARRRKRFGGRFYNWITGENADYVSLSGTHLRQVLGVLGYEPPEFVVGGGEYQLRMDYAQQAIDALAGRLASDGQSIPRM
ncbi:hypothetical protein [Roseinatronobacter monicus]|nr:hypothetical protein [Roseinatronobacter monicus]